MRLSSFGIDNVFCRRILWVLVCSRLDCSGEHGKSDELPLMLWLRESDGPVEEPSLC